MQPRGPRALHPRLVARTDPDETARIVTLDADEVADARSRHRRPTVQMTRAEIERAVAESALPTPARTRLARGSEQLEVTPTPVLIAPVPAAPAPLAAFDLDPDSDPYPDPALLLLPFRARRPVLATAITAALAAAFLLALHHIISAG